jgi:hypothetical protein
MRCKLLRSGICKNFGKYYNKKFYEYGLYTKDELDKISRDHTAKRNEIMRLKEDNPQKYANLSYPKMMLPTPTTQDINECVYQHKKEIVNEVVKKHNGNIQIFVEDSEPVKETIEDTESIIDVAKRGRKSNG